MSVIHRELNLVELQAEVLWIVDSFCDSTPWLDEEIAKDAASDALGRALQRDLPIDELPRFAKSCVRNALRNLREREQLRRTDTLTESEHPESPESHGPSAGLDTAEFWEVACRDLTERQAEAVRLCHRDGLTQEEAAERMGVRQHVLSEHLSRAEPTIKANLEKYLAC